MNFNLSVSNQLGFFFLFLLIFGCQKQDVVEFPQQHQLKGLPVEEITMCTNGNVGLCVADTFLVLQKAEEPFLQIYSTNTHELLAEFGREGKGPGEFLSAVLKKQIGYDSGNNSPVVYVFDIKRQTVSSINILNVVEEGAKAVTEKLPVGNFAVYFFYRGKNFFLAAPNRSGRFLIHNYETSRDTVIPFLPKVNFSIDERAMDVVYRSTARVNLEKGLIASAPLLLGELDFFDLKGNYLRSTIFEARDKFEEELKAGTGKMAKTKYQIADLDTKNDLIYGLNQNNSVKTFYEPTRKNNVKVQVFNWEGQAIKEYILDDRLITSFAIDPTHDRIYAYAPNEQEHTIRSYSMK